MKKMRNSKIALLVIALAVTVGVTKGAFAQSYDPPSPMTEALLGVINTVSNITQENNINNQIAARNYYIEQNEQIQRMRNHERFVREQERRTIAERMERIRIAREERHDDHFDHFRDNRHWY